MIKWFAYIGLLLIFATRISSVNANTKGITLIAYAGNKKPADASYTIKTLATDTTTKTKKQQEDEKKKIKEIAKAKKQAKPATVDDDAAAVPKPKPKRQRRPEGMERPPEIPRRNGN
jgi:hypothetical protein